MKKIFAGVITLSLLSLVIMPSVVFAIVGPAESSSGFNSAQNFDSGPFENNSLEDKIMNLVNILSLFLVIIVVLIMLYGGYKWKNAGDNDEKKSRAKATIITGVSGLAIIITFYSMAIFIINSFKPATGA